MSWTPANERRITELRRLAHAYEFGSGRRLTAAEKLELRELRRHETVEATRRRIELYKRSR